MNTQNSDSESDISSSLSSWSVIGETEKNATEKNSREKFNIKNATGSKADHINLEIIETVEINEIIEDKESDNEDFVNIIPPNGQIDNSLSNEDDLKNTDFLTFNEYLEEQMLEHDYKYPKKGHKKTSKRNRRKCRAETIGILSLCASLFTVTGIALLCIVFPENIEPKHFNTIKTNYQAVVKNDTLNYKDIIGNFNKTLEVLQVASDNKLIQKCADSIQKTDLIVNNTTLSKEKPFSNYGPSNDPRIKRYSRGFSRKPNRVTRVYYPPGDVCYKSDYYKTFANDNYKTTTKAKPAKFNTSIKEPLKTLKLNSSLLNKNLSVLKTVLGNSTLRGIICAILNDICMLKLISYFNKSENSKSKSQKRKCKHFEKHQLAEVLNELCKNNPTRKRKIRVAKRKIKIKVPTATTKTPEIKNTNSLSIKSNPEDKSLVEFTTPSPIDEFKSTCNELESLRQKSQTIGLKHKDIILMMKDEYKSEINSIKESEDEPFMRLHKIEQTREKYRLNLKKNRERYLRALRKMKMQRTNMMKELCTKKELDKEVKDACVGSYVVPLSNQYDFSAKLQMLNEKCSNTNYKKLTPISFEKFSKYKELQEKSQHKLQEIPRINSLQSFPLMRYPKWCAIDVNGKKVNLKECSTTTSSTYSATKQNEKNVGPNTRNAEEAKHDMYHQWSKLNNAKMLQQQSNENFFYTNNIIRKRSIAKNQSEKNKDSYSLSIEEEPTCSRPSKYELYDLVFEDKADQIKKDDQRKFSNERQWVNFCKIQNKNLCKHDPQKNYKQNILHYKKLI